MLVEELGLGFSSKFRLDTSAIEPAVIGWPTHEWMGTVVNLGVFADIVR